MLLNSLGIFDLEISSGGYNKINFLKFLLLFYLKKGKENEFMDGFILLEDMVDGNYYRGGK